MYMLNSFLLRVCCIFYLQVVEWPRANVISQSQVKAETWLIWRQVVLAQQTTNICSVDDYPRTDSSNKIIFVKPEVGFAKSTHNLFL